MKKMLLLMVLAVCHMTITTAQERNVKVTGDVTDYETSEPVIAATVQLLSMPDSTFLSGATTDFEGLFELENRLSQGNYLLKVSFVGYGDAHRNFTVTKDTRSVRLDSIQLKTDALLLKEAVIEAQMAQVQVSEDTVIFNAEAFRVSEGSMLEELIRKLPGYEVESDGTVKYNGKTVSKILVDGKEFFSDDKSIAMKNLPASMVKKVKSYEKKSDLAEMTGIDDGEEELVLDLTVKDDAKKGWFSNIDVGYGRPTQEVKYDIHNLYTVKGMVNRFKENEHYSVILSTNNINDRGFPGGGPGGRGGGNGMNQSSMGGFSMAKNLGEEIEKNKYQFQIGGGVRFFHNDSDVQSQTASETFLKQGSDNSFSNSRSQSNNENLRVSADLRLEWRPDTMTNIIFRPTMSYSKSNNASNNLSATFNKDPYDVLDSEEFADEDYEPLDSTWTDESRINFNSRQSTGGSESTSVNGRLQINHKFNSEGRNLTLSLNGGYSTSENFSSSTSFTRFYQRNDSTSTINRYNTTPSKNYNYNARVMWSEPLWKATFLQLSYQFNYRYNDSERSTYNLPDKLDYWGLPDWLLPDDYERYLSEELSRLATYENLDHDITAQLRLVRDKYNMNVGFTLLPQRSKMSYQYMGVDIDTVRTVFNFTPTMNFRYRWSKQRSLRINYRGRSSQPSMTDLLDIRDDSDPLNVTIGNPGLKPTFNNSLNLQFRDFNVERLQNISANLRLNSTLNSIVNKITYNEETGGRESQPTNLDGWWSNWNAGAGIAYNTALPNQRYKVSSSTNANYSHQEGFVRTSVTNDYPLSTTHSVTLSERLSGTYQNDWFEITLQGSLNYNHARNDLQPTANRDTYIFSYGPSTNINLPWWNIKISSDIGMNSRRGFSDPEFNTDELIWNAQVSKSFLAQNAATVSVQFFDILGQQSNVSRVVNATMRSDTWYNTVNSYFMVHFIYKLNLFGDKESRREARSQGEQMMPPPPADGPRGGFAPPMRGPGMGFGGGFGGGFGPM